MCTRNLLLLFFFSIAKARTVTKAETYVIKSIDLLYFGDIAAQADIPVSDSRCEILQLNQSSVIINYTNN